MALLSALAAASAGAAFGVVASPNPHDHDPLASATYTAAVAVQAAQRSEQRAKLLEKALAEANGHLDALRAVGSVDELEQFQEAERLGLDRAMKSDSLLPDDKRRVLAAVVRESRRNGLDPLLVAAIIQVESRFDRFAVSHVGACGLMQLMPPTAQQLSGDKVSRRHLFDPILNIQLGTVYLAKLLQQFDGDLRKALIAYNAGPSVARSLVKGSRAAKRLDTYPQAVLSAYRILASLRLEEAGPLAER